jgi:hypothetical protein
MITVIRTTDPRAADPRAVYVGRRTRTRTGSALANPWRIGAGADRAQVVAFYELWLGRQLQRPESHAAIALARLVELARAGDLYLVCWCAPEPCHADVIKRRVEERVAPEVAHA